MKIAVIGTGNMGSALARSIALAHDQLFIGARDPSKAATLARSIGPEVESGDIRAAVKAADMILLALPYAAGLEVVQSENVAQKILVDVSNPITADYTDLVIGHSTSAAEELQARAPTARVVKAFNTIFSALLPQEARKDTVLQVFVAGSDVEARQAVEHLVKAMGFEPIDAGPLSNSRFLEPMGEMNIHFGFFLGWGPVAAPVWRRV